MVLLSVGKVNFTEKKRQEPKLEAGEGESPAYGERAVRQRTQPEHSRRWSAPGVYVSSQRSVCLELSQPGREEAASQREVRGPRLLLGRTGASAGFEHRKGPLSATSRGLLGKQSQPFRQETGVPWTRAAAVDVVRRGHALDLC